MCSHLLGRSQLVLAELNAEAVREQERRFDDGWRACLVTITEASRRLAVPARTLRTRLHRGQLAAVRGPGGRGLVEAAWCLTRLVVGRGITWV